MDRPAITAVLMAPAMFLACPAAHCGDGGDYNVYKKADTIYLAGKLGDFKGDFSTKKPGSSGSSSDSGCIDGSSCFSPSHDEGNDRRHDYDDHDRHRYPRDYRHGHGGSCLDSVSCVFEGPCTDYPYDYGPYGGPGEPGEEEPPVKKEPAPYKPEPILKDTELSFIYESVSGDLSGFMFTYEAFENTGANLFSFRITADHFWEKVETGTDYLNMFSLKVLNGSFSETSRSCLRAGGGFQLVQGELGFGITLQFKFDPVKENSFVCEWSYSDVHGAPLREFLAGYRLDLGSFSMYCDYRALESSSASLDGFRAGIKLQL